MSFAVNNIYYIINAVFNLKVGLASDQDPNQLFQHIVGDRYDFGSSTRFVVTWTAEDTIRLSIDGAEIGENNGKVVACIDGAGDEWVTNLVSSTNGRYLYQIALAKSPNLVWALNIAMSPGNQVHLEERNPNNPRQFWELDLYPL